MKRIKNIEKVIVISKDWKPSDIAFIKKLELSVDPESFSVINLEITFLSQMRNNVKGWPDTSKDFFEVSINFNSLSNFQIDFSGSGIHQISGFDIIDVSADNWEGVNFKIEDYENGSISFNCREIVIVSVSNPQLYKIN